MALEDCSTRIIARLTPLTSPIERLAAAAEEISFFFAVTPGDVAIFSCDSDRQALVLRWPAALRTAGTIPIAANNCLVAKTARDDKGFSDNAFSSTPHLYMFEHFLSPGEGRIPIQKIISAPMRCDGELRGVVQVARKGVDRQHAGNDFTGQDLSALEGLTAVLARFF